MELQLRDYQQEQTDELREKIRTAHRVLYQAPTGSGKTAVASWLVDRSASNKKLAFFVCHRTELVQQTSLTFRKFGIQHGVVAAGYPMDLRQLVQVCSIDTLRNRMADLPYPALIIFDECHHITANSWAEVQKYYARAYQIGLSATPWRLDGSGLVDHFNDIVLGPTVRWLMDNGHLSEYEIFAPDIPDMRGVARRGGDFAKGEAAKRVDQPKLTGNAIKHWRKYANGLTTVIFATNVDHSKHVVQEFQRAGISAAHLDGSMNRRERKQIITDYAEGRLQVLSNVALFGEGFDLAAIAQRDVTIDCLVDLAPTQSLSWQIQKWGRALRPKQDGRPAIILDHAGNCQRHGFPDDEREWTLEGREKGSRASNGPPPPVTCPECFRQVRQPVPEHCPTCGQLLRKPANDNTPDVDEDGELVRVTAESKAEIRRRQQEEQARAESLQELIQIARERGYKSPVYWANQVWGKRRYKKRA